MSQYKQLLDGSLECLILFRRWRRSEVKHHCVIICMFSEGLNIKIGVALFDRLKELFVHDSDYTSRYFYFSMKSDFLSVFY